MTANKQFCDSSQQTEITFKIKNRGMTQQKIKELLIKTFGEEEANDPDVIRLYTDCLRQAVEEVTNEQSLLDSFAKAAMHAMLTTPERFPDPSGVRLAEMAYTYADFMMQERERRRIAKEALKQEDTK